MALTSLRKMPYSAGEAASGEEEEITRYIQKIFGRSKKEADAKE